MPSKVLTSHDCRYHSIKTVLMLVTAVGVLIIASVAIILLELDAFRAVDSTVSSSQVNTDTYQSVFLTNSQVYFGNITALTDDTLVLSNVYYLQVDTALQGGEGEQASDASSLSLVKLGTNEIHSPEDTMVISREQVLFWENLTKDSEVVKAIKADAAKTDE